MEIWGQKKASRIYFSLHSEPSGSSISVWKKMSQCFINYIHQSLKFSKSFFFFICLIGKLYCLQHQKCGVPTSGPTLCGLSENCN